MKSASAIIIAQDLFLPKMWGERIKRILIIIVVVLLVAWGAKSLLAWQAKKQTEGKPFAPLASVDQFLTETTSRVLGLAVNKLSGAKTMSDKVISSASENEPIVQPVEKIQQQTQQLIESIKKLPEDQIEAVKKQMVKDFCQKFLQE